MTDAETIAALQTENKKLRGDFRCNYTRQLGAARQYGKPAGSSDKEIAAETKATVAYVDAYMKELGIL